MYVFLTLANNCGEGVTTRTETAFTLDDEPTESFQHIPDMTSFEFRYQSLAYSRTGLSHRTHTLTARTGNTPYDLFVNFDYAMYTCVPSASLIFSG